VLDDNTVGITSDYYAYLQAIRLFNNKETVRINLLATPGIDTQNHSDLIEETIEMVEQERCDTFYVVTTPDTDSGGAAINENDAVGIIDGLYDSSYAATYFSWGQYNDTENNRYVWLPPTCAVMKAAALTDKRAKQWFPIAGTTRGVTNFVQARVKPNLDERDTLYEGRINPLMTQAGLNSQGDVFIWGNKTLQIADSSLNDINVRRMLLYVRQAISDVAINLLFELNDRAVRQQFERLINPILANVRDERGIQRFKIQLDSSEAALATKELRGKIVIQPTRALEFIYVDFTLTDTVAEFQNI
jgi:hypothetical protein